MSLHTEERAPGQSSGRLGFLGRAVAVGLVFGAFGLGTASFITADDSNLLFSPEEQAMFGAFAGAIAGTLVGLLLWLGVVTADLVSRLIRRARNRRRQA